MRYFIVAGEASGDLHASHLMRALKDQDPEAQFCFWGGDLMASCGGNLKKHYRDLAFMGIAEVLANLKTILSNFRRCKKDIQDFQPDVVLLVDYPGFNLRMARWAKKNGYRVLYYISPTVWAWHESRIKTIRKCVDRLYAILPFEQEFYRERGLEVEYFGHPLVDVIYSFYKKAGTPEEFRALNLLDSRPLVALLAGSRKQELHRVLPVMVETAEFFPDFQFVVAGAPGLAPSDYEPITGGQVKLVFGQTYELVHHATAALVTSGTATLETALLATPQVVCYRTSSLTYRLGRLLIRLKYISLVNLIAGKEVVRELIQRELNRGSLRRELQSILIDGPDRAAMVGEYRKIHGQLGKPGVAGRIAHNMVQFLNKRA